MAWFPDKSIQETQTQTDVDSLSAYIQRLTIVSRRLVLHEFAGAYRSAFVGRGMDFSDVRPYQPGDEVRWIDWNVSARMDQVYIKQFVEERERTVILVWDASASMTLGSHWASKREVCAEMAMILAMSAVSNQDRVGLLISDTMPAVPGSQSSTETIGENVRIADSSHRQHCPVSYVRPQKGRAHMMRIVRDILSWSEPSPSVAQQAVTEQERVDSHKEEVLPFLYRVVPPHSIVFFFSDFLEPIDKTNWQRLARRCDVIPVLVRDPIEVSVALDVPSFFPTTGPMFRGLLFFLVLFGVLGAIWGGVWLWAAGVAVFLGAIGTWILTQSRSPSLVGLYDLENRESLWLDLRAIPLAHTTEYQEPSLEKQTGSSRTIPVGCTIEQVETEFQRMGLGMIALHTSDSPIDALRTFFRRRQQSTARAKGRR